MIKAVIIDDEKRSRDTLVGMIERYCPTIEVIGQADGCQAGVNKIKELSPEIVFLDIQMPDGSGFKLLEDIKEYNFEVIFTTAHDQYAIKAIRFSALDYILKPINPDDLNYAVDKYIKKQNKGQINKNIQVLLDNIKAPNVEPKIILNTSEGIHIVKTDDIIRCESDDYYTRFYFKNDSMILISKTLKQNEELLNEYNFIRTHKSHLINIKHIKSYLRNEGVIIMSDGSKIPVSRRKKDKIVDILSDLEKKFPY